MTTNDLLIDLAKSAQQIGADLNDEIDLDTALVFEHIVSNLRQAKQVQNDAS